MANSSKFSRRNFMQQSALWAAAFAGGTTTVPGIAAAAREKELNILCWEGYNSAQVLDPFRSSTGATVKAESLTNDPTMINRLRAGETNVWDLINVNNPWARKVMHPEKLIKPLDRARFEPYFDKMMPAFKAPYKWAMDDSGTELLGMAQRFGPYSFVVNTDKVSRATAEDQGWNLWNDAANDKKYGVLESDDWNVFCICCIAGFDPFKIHADDEVAKFTDAAKRVFKGAKAVADLASMNQLLIAGEIDFHLTGGTYSASPARADGHPNIRGITPKSGPMQGGKGGISWIEITSTVNNPELSPLAAGLPRICPGARRRPYRGLRRGHVQSGVPDGQPRLLQAVHQGGARLRYSGTASKRRWPVRSNTISCPITTSCSTS